MNADAKEAAFQQDMIDQMVAGGSSETIKHVFSPVLSDCSLGASNQMVQNHSRYQEVE